MPTPGPSNAPTSISSVASPRRTSPPRAIGCSSSGADEPCDRARRDPATPPLRWFSAALLAAGVRIVGLGLRLLRGLVRFLARRWSRGRRGRGPGPGGWLRRAAGLLAGAAGLAPRHLDRLALGERLGVDHGELAEPGTAQQHEEILGARNGVCPDEVRIVLR